MAAFVYILCALTSFACAVLLLRAYRRGRVRLLLWSGLGFVGFAIGNTMLVLDLVIFPTSVDLTFWRPVPVLAGLVVLLYGLVWEAR
jgi:hypothetical protein